MSNQPQDNIKDDSGKPRLALLPGYCPLTLEALGRLATFGAAKHGEGSWMEGEQYRWLDAAYRHLSEYHKGEKIDPETGENHLVAVCINFMYACELELSSTPLPKHEYYICWRLSQAQGGIKLYYVEHCISCDEVQGATKLTLSEATKVTNSGYGWKICKMSGEVV